MINWPDPLITDISKNRAVLVLGAGVSMNSQDDRGNRPPDWEKFLNDAMIKLEGDTSYIKSLIDSGDFLTACEIIMEKDKEQFEEHAKECFLRPGYKDHEIHKHIFDLNVQFVIT